MGNDVVTMNDFVVHTELNRQAQIVLTAIGVIDPVTALLLFDPEIEAGEPVDVVDLRFVSLLSAAGVTALVRLNARRPIRVIGSQSVLAVLDAVGLADTFGATSPTAPPNLHQAPFGLAVHDADLRFDYVNDALAAINGLPAQDHYGCLPRDLFDVRDDDVSSILRDVLDTGVDRAAHIVGVTSNVETTWHCRYWRSRYESSSTSQPESVVVAVVDRLEPSAPAPTHDRRLVFEPRVTRPST